MMALNAALYYSKLYPYTIIYACKHKMCNILIKTVFFFHYLILTP